MATEFLTPQGFESFEYFACRTRWDEPLQTIKELVKQYVQLKPNETQKRCEKLALLLTHINKWLDAQKDPTAAQKKNERLQTLASLKYEVEDALRGIQRAANPEATAKQNWAILRHGVNKVFNNSGAPDPTRHPGAKPAIIANNMADPNLPEIKRVNNWLEVVDGDHHRGAELKKHYETWEKSNETCSFWTYLGRLVPEEQAKLEKVKVHYVEDLVMRTLFQVQFRGDKLYSKMDPDLQKDIVKREYANPNLSANEARKKKAGLVNRNDWKPLDTAAWQSNAFKSMDGYACFVYSTDGVLYVGQHTGGQFHHSSFLCGAPVLAAGMIRVENGNITDIDGKNGHYQANDDSLLEFLFFLKRSLSSSNAFNKIRVSFWERGFRKAGDAVKQTPPAVPSRVGRPLLPGEQQPVAPTGHAQVITQNVQQPVRSGRPLPIPGIQGVVKQNVLQPSPGPQRSGRRLPPLPVRNNNNPEPVAYNTD